MFRGTLEDAHHQTKEKSIPTQEEPLPLNTLRGLLGTIKILLEEGIRDRCGKTKGAFGDSANHGE